MESRTLGLLKFFNLLELKDELAGNLSGGQKKLLEIARALILNPDLLLLDEPFHGIHPAFQREIVKAVRTLRQEGKTFILVSHDIPSVMAACDIISVLCAGQVIAEGNGEDIRKNKEVIQAYLGV
jgi:branched-chain amino acid transport system ATP-binding protein